MHPKHKNTTMQNWTPKN